VRQQKKSLTTFCFCFISTLEHQNFKFLCLSPITPLSYGGYKQAFLRSHDQEASYESQILREMFFLSHSLLDRICGGQAGGTLVGVSIKLSHLCDLYHATKFFFINFKKIMGADRELVCALHTVQTRQ
jgi:hypothetical protein